MHIVDVWESEDAYNKFRDERLGPAVEAVMGGAPEGGPPSNEFHQLHNVVRP